MDQTIKDEELTIRWVPLVQQAIKLLSAIQKGTEIKAQIESLNTCAIGFLKVIDKMKKERPELMNTVD